LQLFTVWRVAHGECYRTESKHVIAEHDVLKKQRALKQSSQRSEAKQRRLLLLLPALLLLLAAPALRSPPTHFHSLAIGHGKLSAAGKRREEEAMVKIGIPRSTTT